CRTGCSRDAENLPPVGLPPGLLPEGARGIQEIGPKGYIGGMWEESGELQVCFLVDEGLCRDMCRWTSAAAASEAASASSAT
ncbi:MAG: hypothetical protein AB7T14_09970, partial [Candidatus Methylacidiphilaceae bacterium]